MTRAQFLTTLLMWPAVAAHELTHYLIACRIGRGVSVRLTAAEPAVTVEAWREDASGWQIVACAYAPLLAGLVVGGVALLAGLLVGFPTPSSERQWAIVTLALGYYVVFILPSPSDMQTAQEGFDRVE